MFEIYYFITRNVGENFFYVSLIISILFFVIYLFHYIRSGKTDPSYLWAYFLGTAVVLSIELTMGLLRVRNFGARYSPLMSIIQGFLEGGVLASLIAYLTRKIMNKEYKTFLVITLIVIGLGLFILISIPLAKESSYTSYRAISHPFSMLSFSVWYILVFFMFWIFPPGQDKNEPRFKLTTTRKAVILYYFIGILYSSIWLSIWISTGNRSIYYGFMGGPYFIADPFSMFLWICFNNFVENISVFIGSWGIGVRFGLIKVNGEE
ncbi:MAG: hypothetical protein ACTSR3_19810 [Candidatus Helarchaeota archaeon]